MKSRPKRPTPSRAKSSSTANGGDSTVILVRRGALRRFDALMRKTAELPVIVSWDRRLGERRGAGSTPERSDTRRAGDRRQMPPFTWDLADFVVVPGASAHLDAPARRAASQTARTKPAARKSSPAARTGRIRARAKSK